MLIAKQVPSLLAPGISVQLNDSSIITEYLYERYPSLLPAQHKATIKIFLAKLHEIAYVVLSFKPEERRAEGIIEDVRTLIARKDISEKYREALQRKLDQ